VRADSNIYLVDGIALLTLFAVNSVTVGQSLAETVATCNKTIGTPISLSIARHACVIAVHNDKLLVVGF
jgi:hypothetical protein